MSVFTNKDVLFPGLMLIFVVEGVIHWQYQQENVPHLFIWHRMTPLHVSATSGGLPQEAHYVMGSDMSNRLLALPLMFSRQLGEIMPPTVWGLLQDCIPRVWQGVRPLVMVHAPWTSLYFTLPYIYWVNTKAGFIVTAQNIRSQTPTFVCPSPQHQALVHFQTIPHLKLLALRSCCGQTPQIITKVSWVVNLAPSSSLCIPVSQVQRSEVRDWNSRGVTRAVGVSQQG